jgi:RNA polymerase sigma-70 factor (ECF subfamily)
MKPNTLSSAGSKASRQAQLEFFRELAPFRGDLFRFCRSLTNSPWDAEDLAQETLLKVFGRLGDKHAGIDNPKSYLFKTAANLWIDWCRRARLPLEEDALPTQPYQLGYTMEVRNALAWTLQFLPPRERLAFVLKDVFELSLEEVAEVSQTSVNAVKAALHRARSKIAAIPGSPTSDILTFRGQHRELVDAAVSAFNRRDISAMCDLFLSSATGNAPGCFLENGIDEIKRGSLFHTFNAHDGGPLAATMVARCVEVAGVVLFVIMNGDVVDDVWRFHFSDGKIASFDCYYCCPGVLAEIAEVMGTSNNYHGYYFEDRS